MFLNPYYNKVNYEMFIAGYLQANGIDIKKLQPHWKLTKVERGAHKCAADWLNNQLRLDCI